MNHQVHKKPTKQELGAYYTPSSLAQHLTDWAIRTSTDTILDPSFGGCAFLCAALNTLSSYGVQNPGRQIFGVDIDTDAEGYLPPLYKAGATTKQFIIEDFFSIEAWPDSILFDCIVGNPPFINYHDIKPEAQTRAVIRLKESNFQISGRASYWAYFLLHSLCFLKEGGRIAMVLPGPFLRADYAASVRKLITSHFAQCQVILLKERIFEGTEEQAVVLLANGYHKKGSHSSLTVREAATIAELCSIAQNTSTATLHAPYTEAEHNLYMDLLPSSVVKTLERLRRHPSVIRLGDWIDVRIGVVTGANDYFTMKPSKQAELRIPNSYVIPIVKRPRHINGLYFTQEDHQALRRSDEKCVLLAIDGTDLFHSAQEALPQELNNYLSNASTDVKQATKCKERKPWYAIKHRFAPPAFFQYMSVGWPHIVVNQTNTTCLNNIHRLRWVKERTDEDWTDVAIGSLSSLSQLSAELLGRSYGSGLLKLEPKEVVQILLPIPDQVDNELASIINQLLRSGKKIEATQLVDKTLLVNGLGLSTLELESIVAAKHFLYARRQGI